MHKVLMLHLCLGWQLQFSWTFVIVETLPEKHNLFDLFFSYFRYSVHMEVKEIKSKGLIDKFYHFSVLKLEKNETFQLKIPF